MENSRFDQDKDFSAEDDQEAMQIFSAAADSEFVRLKRNLRRQHGYDLTWWEKILFKFGFKFK